MKEENIEYVNTDKKQTKKRASQKFSIQRFIINIIVRSLFFLYPVPLPIVNSHVEMTIYLPIGFSILVIGVLIGGILDIFLPRKYVIGGKIATKSFNIGTISFFEGMRFKVDVGASGKGIALKDPGE